MDARSEVLSLVDAAWTTQAIGAACELGLPDALAAGLRAPADIARATDADADAVRRLLRALVTLGVCIEDDAGTFGLTPAGEWLRRDRPGSLDAWARLSSRRLWSNWAELATSVRTGRSTRSRRLGVDDFTHLDNDPDGARVFNAAMVSITRPVAIAAARVVDWSGVETLVDVGGGVGELAAAIVASHPHVRGIVFDLEHAGAAARAHLVREGVADRCEFRAGDFFEAVPAADACVLKSVVHNWDDARALQILRRCAEALAPGGRVLLLERVLPERLTPADREVARSDLNMLVGCGSSERTEARLAALLDAAGLAAGKARPLAQGFSVIEGRRAPAAHAQGW